MRKNESTEERKKRFKMLSSEERKKLIREKLKIQGLIEGSGVREKNQAYYDKKEMIDLICITNYFPKNNSS